MRLPLVFATLLACAALPARADTVPPAAPGAEPLIVAGKSGLVEIAPDGKVLRTLTRTPAASPRWMPGRREIVFLSYGPGGSGAVKRVFEVWRIGRDGTGERRVATLPPPRCGDDRLDIQAPEDFVVDRKGRYACMSLKDRNVNMMNVDISVRVDLLRGRIARRQTFPENKDACDLPRGEEFECTPARDEAPPRRTEVSAPAGFAATLPSPSGQWVVLRGNESEGDYMHADAFLFDVKARKSHPIRKGPWPAPLKDLKPRPDQTVDIVGESDIRWMGEALLVDSLLVRPGAGGVQIDGDMIR